jgi:hypothetical protein
MSFPIPRHTPLSPLLPLHKYTSTPNFPTPSILYLEMIKTLSQIEEHDEVTDNLYADFWQSLLSVCENVHTVFVPVRWTNKFYPGFFPSLKVTVIKRDDDFE